MMPSVRGLKRMHAIETLRADWCCLRILRSKPSKAKWFEFHYWIIREKALIQIPGCAGGDCSN